MKGPENNVWEKMKQHAGSMLGDEFWRDIEKLMPQRFPKIDMYETDKELVVEVELPGLDSQEDVHIGIDVDTLTLSGELIRRMPVQKATFLEQERTLGSFHRQIHLPASVETETIQAKIFNGLLVIRIEKLNGDKRSLTVKGELNDGEN